MKKVLALIIFIFGFINQSFCSEINPIYFGVDLEGFPINIKKLKNVQKEVGIRSDIIVFFLMWPSKKKYQ